MSTCENHSSRADTCSLRFSNLSSRFLSAFISTILAGSAPSVSNLKRIFVGSAVTLTTPASQTSTQLLQRLHFSGCFATIFFSSLERTPFGQTLTQLPPRSHLPC